MQHPLRLPQDPLRRPRPRHLDTPRRRDRPAIPPARSRLGRRHGVRDNRSAGAPAPTFTAEAHRWSWSLRSNNQANATVRSIGEPAGTLFFGHRANECICIAEPIGARSENETEAAPEPIRITAREAGILQTFPDPNQHAQNTSWLNAVLNTAREHARGLTASYLHTLVQVCPWPRHASAYARVIETEHAAAGGMAAGPMPEAIELSDGPGVWTVRVVCTGREAASAQTQHGVVHGVERYIAQFWPNSTPSQYGRGHRLRILDCDLESGELL